MKRSDKRTKLIAVILSAMMVFGIYGSVVTTPCAAATEKKADLGAISGFGNNYTVDEKGKFEIEGAMVTHGSVYNITVDGEFIQSWCGKLRGRSWGGEELIDLLNDPTTLFYGKVSGTKKSSEFSDPVEFARPNGESF